MYMYPFALRVVYPTRVVGKEFAFVLQAPTEPSKLVLNAICLPATSKLCVGLEVPTPTNPPAVANVVVAVVDKVPVIAVFPPMVAVPVVTSVATCKFPVPVAFVNVTPAKELTPLAVSEVSVVAPVTSRVELARTAPANVAAPVVFRVAT